MLDAPWLKRIGASPAKIALIAVLAVVLLVVIVVQMTRSPDAPPISGVAEATVVRNDRRPKSAEPSEEVAQPQTDVPSVIWPESALSEVVRHDPFQLPAQLRTRPEVADNRQDQQNRHILQTLSDSSTAVILMVGDEHVARIGAETLRPGDKIGGYRVSKIDATGVWLVDEREEPNH